MIEQTIHTYGHWVEFYTNRIAKNKQISASNRKTLLNYANSLYNRSIPTIAKNLQAMEVIAVKLSKDFDKVVKQDIDAIMFWINSNQKWAPATKQKFAVCIKRFFKWFYQLPKGHYPDIVRDVETTLARSNRKLPSDLLTIQDVSKLIGTCLNARDKCLIAMLFDLGCRIGELGMVNINHISDEDNFCKVTLPSGKTGARVLPIINSKPYLLKWLNEHPKLNGRESPLFIELGSGDQSSRLNYAAIRKMLQNVAKRAKLAKPVNPHHFRHSTATIYAKYFPPHALDMWFGWLDSNKTSNIYVHLSGKDLLESYLKFYNSKENILRMQVCSKCGEENQGLLDYCRKCSTALKVNTILTQEQKERALSDEVMNKLIEDPAVKEFLVKKILETGLATQINLGALQ